MPAAVAEKSLLETLETVIENLPPNQMTLEQILTLIGREGLLMFCIFLTIPFMVPVSIPGVSTVFGFTIFLIGVSMLANRLPWLPDRLLRHPFPSERLKTTLRKGTIWVQRIEKFSSPRLLALTHGDGFHRLNGGMLLLGAVLLMFPFGFIPFSNTLPGLAVLFLALGMLQRDGYCVLLGYLTNLATMIYFGFLLLGGALAGQKLFELLQQWWG